MFVSALYGAGFSPFNGNIHFFSWERVKKRARSGPGLFVTVQSKEIKNEASFCGTDSFRPLVSDLLEL